MLFAMPQDADPEFSLYQLDRDLTREQLVAELAAMPQRVRAIVAGHDLTALQRRASSEEWSALNVCRHLRDAAQVYGMRFKWIILQERPVLPDYDEKIWAASEIDGPASLPKILDEIEAWRGETVRLLTGLAPDGWSREGRHEVLGTVKLEPYVRHEISHEAQHLDQLRQAFVGQEGAT